MRQESAALQKSGNLEVDRKLPSTLQTQHQLRACKLAGSVATNKVQAEARKNKKNEEEESEAEASSKKRSIFFAETKVDSQRLAVILDQDCRSQCL